MITEPPCIHNGAQMAICRICGCYAWGEADNSAQNALKTLPRTWRCSRHGGRNPCAIEGCERSTKAHQGVLADDSWLCAEHWRAFVPPRSAARRVYQRFFRQAKRQGWSPALRRRFWRFWNALIARARRASAGDLDMKEINAMFGWGE